MQDQQTFAEDSYAFGWRREGWTSSAKKRRCCIRSYLTEPSTSRPLNHCLTSSRSRGNDEELEAEGQTERRSEMDHEQALSLSGRAIDVPVVMKQSSA